MRFFGVVVVAVAMMGAEPSNVQAADPLRVVVALGTSLTARGGWLDPLATALSQCVGHPVRVEPVALSGASSRWGLTAVDTVVAEAPDVVLVEFATNDAALNRLMPPWTSRRNLRGILDRLAGAEHRPRVIVMAMNPVDGLPRLVRPLLGFYNSAHAHVAAETGAGFVDFGPAWRVMSAQDLRQAIPDGLHPSPDQATRIMVPRLSDIVAQQACGLPR